MAALLPDDVLHIICDQLWEQRDFDTLYRCTCSGKQLAVPALASIYRYLTLGRMESLIKTTDAEMT